MAWTKDLWRRRRASVLVIAALLLLVLLGFAAAAVDVGRLAAARQELRTSVDNTALSTAHYIANRGLRLLPEQREAVARDGIAFGEDFIKFNDVQNIELTVDSVETGLADWQDRRVVGFTPYLTAYDAVRVRVTMSPTTNSELPAILGHVFGRPAYQPTAEAIAVLDVRWSRVLPFTYLEDAWDTETNPGQDHWWWDDLNHQAVEQSGVDGLPEIVLYPSKHDGGPACSGNFGALDFESCGGGNPCLIHWITNGVPPEEYGGSIPPYPEISGSPGVAMGAGVVHAIEDLIGQIAGVFIHQPCVESGNNALYHIVDIRYALVMNIFNDPDSPGSKAILIQPIDPNTPPGKIEVLGLGK